MKPYSNLRKALFLQDKNIKDLPNVIGKSASYVNARMNAYAENYWTEMDMYKILKFLGEDEDKTGFYFSLKQRKG